MSDGGGAAPPSDPSGLGPEVHTSIVDRYGYAQRVGGLLAPVLTVVLAFLVGGLVIVLTGHAPWSVYEAIFRGSGLNWFLPWVQGAERATAAFNLQQTLIVSASLVLTGLAVGFAFRCGLFNIGGQGQYLAGSIVAVIVGSNLEGMSPVLHIGFAVVLGSLAGAALAGVAGLLKATVGAHEVITTIMLNWIVVWVGVFLFTLTGPLQSTTTNAPISADVVPGARLPVIWGDPLLQGLHAGAFAALGGLVAYWAILSRTTLGLGVKAVGFNPEAARYTGIEVGRSYVVSMAIAGTFAGLAGTIDISRMAVPPLHRRHPGLDARVRRDRGRAAGPKYGCRHWARCARLRGAPDRDVVPEPRRRGVFAAARVEPDAPHPGPRGARARRGRARALAAPQCA